MIRPVKTGTGKTRLVKRASQIVLASSIALSALRLAVRPFSRNKPQPLPAEKRTKEPHFAVLIPARDESKVIEGLLKDLRRQTQKVPASDIFIIIEQPDDPTAAIAKKYGMNVRLRKDMGPGRKCKGCALEEVVEDIWPKLYDAYFIFDADNRVDKDFFKEMTKTWLQGYDIGIGFRNIKNPVNAMAVASGMIFTALNVLGNKMRTRRNMTCNVTGTGFYISGRVLNQLKTYPFHTLTEDYELSLYACVNNLTCCYNDKAVFYDEQPTDYNQYFKQRVRWVKGYMQARKIYYPQLVRKARIHNPNLASVIDQLVGVGELVFAIIGLFLLFLHDRKSLKYIVLEATYIYVVLFVFSEFLLLTEKRYHCPKRLLLKSLLLNPLLLLSYIPCGVKAIFKKDVKWDKIEHGEQQEKAG